MSLRPPAVAGSFYPADRAELDAFVHQCFATSVAPEPGAAVPRALVVPHAGLIYSGPIAASAYRRLEPARARIERVVLLGPSHRVPLQGLALSSADAWATPLGEVPLEFPTSLLDRDWITVDDRAHGPEHSLEVQLPFLQTVLDEFHLVPLVVGQATTDQVAEVLEELWSDPTTVVVVSTDLSHYHHYEQARRLDARTAAAIAAMQHQAIGDLDACGARPLRGLLQAAHDRQLRVDQLDLRNSGDTAGDKTQVVGYGAFALA